MEKKQKLTLVIISLINIIRSCLLIGQAFLMRQIVQDSVSKNDLTIDIVLFASCLVLLVILGMVSLFIKNRLSLNIEVNLKEKLYSKLIVKDVREIKKYHSGEIGNIFISDINNINVGLSEIIPSLSLYLSRFILAIVALSVISYQLLIVLLIIAVISLILMRFYSKIIKRYQKRALESDGKINSFVEESIENIALINSTDSQKRFTSNIKEALKENYQLKNKRNLLTLIGNGGFSLILNFISGLALIVGCLLIYFGEIEYALLTTIIMLVSYFEGPIQALGSLHSRYNAYKVSKARIDNLFSLLDDRKDVTLDDFDYIEIKDLTFSYDSKNIFSSFNYVINKNDTILIKGPSGRGKTTLFKLILGFNKPLSGSIKVIDKNDSYDSSKIKNFFSYVVQDNILFSLSIRENIYLLSGETDEKKIDEALKLACIYDEIYQKKDKLDTIIKEGGDGLSLGQIQRILLAIALLENRKVLLLDEFTSSLDQETEKKIVNNVIKLPLTKIIITHRAIDIDGAKVLELGNDYE